MQKMKALAEVKFPEYSRMDMSEFILSEFYTSRVNNFSGTNNINKLSANELKKIGNDNGDTSKGEK